MENYFYLYDPLHRNKKITAQNNILLNLKQGIFLQVLQQLLLLIQINVYMVLQQVQHIYNIQPTNFEVIRTVMNKLTNFQSNLDSTNIRL